MTRPGADETADPAGYGHWQVRLHWTIAALIFVQLTVNGGIEYVFNQRMNGLDEPLTPDAVAHMVIGATILVLMLWRVALRWRLGVPPADADAHPIVRLASAATHLSLYVLAVGMPLAGALAWFSRSEFFAQVHELGRPLLVAVIALHILGALFEHFVMGNETLTRMLNRPERD